MNKICQYEVIERLRLSDLVDIVNSRIKEGWEPVGGVAVLHTGEFVQREFYIQAVVRRGEEE